MSSGGKGNSKANTQSTTTTNTSQTTVNTVDNRAVQGDNAAVGGNVTVNPGDSPIGALNISTTDQGAVHAGLDIALESLSAIQNQTKDVLAGLKSQSTATQSLASDSISQAYGLANEARQSETSGAINNVLKYGTWIVLAALVVWGIVRTNKT